MDLKDRIKTEIPNHPKNKQKKRFYIILLVMFAVALAVILVLMLLRHGPARTAGPPTLRAMTVKYPGQGQKHPRQKWKHSG